MSTTKVFKFLSHRFTDNNWVHVRRNAVSLFALPPILDDRWNDLPEVETKPGKNVRLAEFRDELHFSVLAEHSAQFNLTPHANTSEILFHYVFTLDPTNALGSLRVEICMVNTCFLKNVVKAQNRNTYLKNGSEWAHFTIRVKKVLRPKKSIPVDFMDAKSGKVLFDISMNNFLHLSAEVSTLNSTGYWKPHIGGYFLQSCDPQLKVIFADHAIIHSGKVNESSIAVNMTTMLSNVHCLSIHYYLREGYGDAFIQTGSLIRLEPTNGKWKRLALRLTSNRSSEVEVITFKLPNVNTRLEHHVFAMNVPFKTCGEEEYSYIDIHGGEEALPAKIGCQTISYEENETFAFTHETVSEPTCSSLQGCSGGHMFGRYCNISCLSFVTGSGIHCGKMIQCDREKCEYLPGYNASRNCLDKSYTFNNETVIDNTKPVEEEEEDYEYNEDDYSDEEEHEDEGNEVAKKLEEEEIKNINKMFSNFFDVSKKKQNEKGGGINWILVIFFSTSWLISIASVILLFKGRPDLIPACLHAASLCFGHR
ncbi:Hypothetical predicted protein [Cloeon dipterum]|uniref:Uncharacterized protein n=2 Tax=Cloeon dipterum TaxID=197152 RepID=A0A8S1DKS6_9INSE|nr:Hypothetical predicted protein [Cloeon dipterum]